MRHIYINIAVNYLCERSQIVIPVKHNPKKTTPTFHKRGNSVRLSTFRENAIFICI